MKRLFVRCARMGCALVLGVAVTFGGLSACRTAEEQAEADTKPKTKLPSSVAGRKTDQPNGKTPSSAADKSAEKKPTPPAAGKQDEKKSASPATGKESGKQPAGGAGSASGTGGGAQNGGKDGQNGSAENKTPAPNEGGQKTKDQTLTPSAVMEDARTLKLVFRREVSEIIEMKLTPDAALAGAPKIVGEGGGKWTALYTFADGLKSGARYSMTGTAKNKSGKLMPFGAQFTGFNSDLPELEITEIHALYDGKRRDRKFEYVELHAKRGGNLSGLEIRGMYDKCRVKLPTVTVKTGEMIVMHLRSGVEGCIDELGDDLRQATAPYSSESTRDLWDKNTKARLGDAADIIVLHNTADDSVMDAVVYAPAGAPDWEAAIAKNSATAKPEAVARAVGTFKTMLAALVKEKKWPNADIRSAADSEGLTPSRTLEKIAAGTGGSAWKVSGNGGASPGRKAF